MCDGQSSFCVGRGQPAQEEGGEEETAPVIPSARVELLRGSNSSCVSVQGHWGCEG